jgi:hypothetical protein
LEFALRPSAALPRTGGQELFLGDFTVAIGIRAAEHHSCSLWCGVAFILADLAVAVSVQALEQDGRVAFVLCFSLGIVVSRESHRAGRQCDGQSPAVRRFHGKALVV